MNPAPTFELKDGAAPGVITVDAPLTPYMSDTTSAGMSATGSITSMDGNTVTFQGNLFQTETMWDFTGADGNTYWVAAIVEEGTGNVAYLSNYSFKAGEDLTLLGEDDDPGNSANTYNSAYGGIIRIDDVASPGAPSEAPNGEGVTYIAWNVDDVTFSLTNHTFSINAGAKSGSFTSYDNDAYFSDGYNHPPDYVRPPNDMNQLGSASVGTTNNFTNQMFEAERILVLQDSKGNLFKAIMIQANNGARIWVSTEPLDPNESYTIAIDDGSPGIDNNDLPDNQEQFATYKALVPICFARGTEIETMRGPILIENLKAGDMVLTRDNGYKAIAWIGNSSFRNDHSETVARISPIRIRQGALGYNLPARDLYVSPQHRILVRSAIVQRMFNRTEVLVAAKHLLDLEGVEQMTSFDEVQYFHMLFDQHEIVHANGVEAESLYTGPQALKSLSPEAREEIFTIFPQLAEMGDVYGAPPARFLPKGREARKLAERHQRNSHALQ